MVGQQRMTTIVIHRQ